MKRIAEIYLNKWKAENNRKPLLVRGARQVGKTFLVRALGVQFDSFVEINFELNPTLASVFETDLNPQRIIRDLEIVLNVAIIPGKTLLFFDEIQNAPKAIQSLRYFYELMPELHIIAAGSLLEFTLNTIGVPVGRLSSLYLFPLSFVEFMHAAGQLSALRALPDCISTATVTDAVHTALMRSFAEYMAIGGMPAAVITWLTTKKMQPVSAVHRSILETYRQDFNKYGKRLNSKHVEQLFSKIPWMLGRKFKYSAISDSVKKRELEPALDALCKAGIATRIVHSGAQGLPLGAQTNPDRFKLLFLDIGLAQTLLGLQPGEWLLNSTQMIVNKGEIVEAFAGQELLSCMLPDMRPELYYWHREARSSNAEVDYLTTIDSMVIPLEIKSGAAGALRSLALFLQEHKGSPYGIRFYTGKPVHEEKIRSYPIYCLGPLLLDRAVYGWFTKETSN